MFEISLCMIVKDEELVIERLLKCAKQFADEIIIVDTGSKDRTKEICFQYTNFVYDFLWCNDFSKARNFSFSKATKPYIMWLDADDFITQENIEKILALKNTSNPADAYMFKYVLGSSKENSFEFFRERLLKKSKNYMWSGFIHEAISLSGKIEYLDIEIEHRKLKENPRERNLKIYRMAIKNGIKFSPRERYYYSRELYFNGYFKKAICELKKYLKSSDPYTPNIIDAHIILTNIYIQLNNYQNALDTIFSSIKKFTPNAQTCCLTAQIYEKMKAINLCIFWYNCALIAPAQKQGFIQKDYENFIPYMELSRLYYKLDFNESKKYYLLAKSLKPTHKSVIYNSQFFD